MKRRTLIGWGVAALGVVLVLSSCGLVADRLDRLENPVFNAPPYPVSDAARQLQAGTLVADMHSDALISRRDLLKRGNYGSVDLPRLAGAGIALVTFTEPTHGPWCPRQDACGPWPNLLGAWSVVSGWPTRTWFNREKRALYYAERLDTLAAGAGGRLKLIRTRDDLGDFLAAPPATRGIAVVLGIEGAEALDGDPAVVGHLERAGFRIFGLMHNTDNDAGGSSQGVAKGGLTVLGHRVVNEAVRSGLIIDLAHASDATIDDVMAMSLPRPVMVSHGGVRAVCNIPRNLGDAQLKKVVAAGGIVGIGYWDTVLCLGEKSSATDYAAAVARSILHVADVTRQVRPGEEYDHVGLGSDFDGWVGEGFEAGGVVLVTDALLRAGLDPAAIRKILGGNYAHFLLATLPKRPAS